MPERVLVAGATGRLGRELVRQLNSQGYFVRALGRDRTRLHSLCPMADEHIVWDASKEDDLRRACRGMDQVASCMGASVIPTLGQGRRSFTVVDTPANLRLVEAAEVERVRKFVYVSVFTDGKLQENDFVRGHEEVVECLRASKMDYAVVRSTGFFGSLMQIMQQANWGLLPEHRNGESRTNPIHEADLAAFCAEKLRENSTRTEYAVGGPEVLTRRQIAELVRQSSAKYRSVRRVPVSVLRTTGILLRPANRRVGQLMEFIADVLSDDFVAPTYGQITLAQYLGVNQATQEQRL